MMKDISNSIIRGGWQLTPDHLVGTASGDGLAPIIDAVQNGFRIFDCADIYSGVEELLGEAKTSNEIRGSAIRVHTKFVPDLNKLESINFFEVQEVVDRSLKRLKTDCLDLVQFHWWDYRIERYLEILDCLFKIKEAGKISAIGLTNFDSGRLKEIIDAGFDIASIQMQYSLLDRRGERDLMPLCKEYGIRIFSYGSLLGGFLSETWLGKPEPNLSELPNRSLVKYKLIIDDWGGWERYQSVLKQMHDIATQRNCSISQVVIASLLQSGRVDALIVGLSVRNYQKQNRELARLIRLSDSELDQLWSWDCPLEGGVYQLERTNNKHSSIMKYNLNNDVRQIIPAGN